MAGASEITASLPSFEIQSSIPDEDQDENEPSEEDSPFLLEIYKFPYHWRQLSSVPHRSENHFRP
jgi:hypothetical protein